MQLISSAVFGAALLVVLACSPSSPAAASGAKGDAPATQTAAADPNAPTPAPAHANGSTEFQAPSGNIGCDYTPAGGTAVYSTPDNRAELQCDRVEPSYVRFTLSERGAATLINHVGDAGCCGGDTMAYGTHWTGGPFTCDMTQAGLVCTNADRRGFTLSRSTARAN